MDTITIKPGNGGLTSIIRCRVPKKVQKEFRKVARKNGLTESGLLRQVVDDTLNAATSKKG